MSKSRMTRKANKPRCLACDSPEVMARGQCRKCYQNARNMIARGETTEAELVEKNLLLPSWKGSNAVREAIKRSEKRKRSRAK